MFQGLLVVTSAVQTRLEELQVKIILINVTPDFFSYITQIFGMSVQIRIKDSSFLFFLITAATAGILTKVAGQCLHLLCLFPALAKYLLYVASFPKSILFKIKILTCMGNLIHLHNIFICNETIQCKAIYNCRHCKYQLECVLREDLTK